MECRILARGAPVRRDAQWLGFRRVGARGRPHRSTYRPRSRASIPGRDDRLVKGEVVLPVALLEARHQRTQNCRHAFDAFAILWKTENISVVEEHNLRAN